MTLDQIEIGNTCTVVSIQGKGRIHKRLLDMGITPNTLVYVRKRAPMGDPIEITLRGYELVLRKDEASFVEVK